MKNWKKFERRFATLNLVMEYKYIGEDLPKKSEIEAGLLVEDRPQIMITEYVNDGVLNEIIIQLGYMNDMTAIFIFKSILNNITTFRKVRMAFKLSEG